VGGIQVFPRRFRAVWGEPLCNPTTLFWPAASREGSVAVNSLRRNAASFVDRVNSGNAARRTRFVRCGTTSAPGFGPTAGSSARLLRRRVTACNEREDRHPGRQASFSKASPDSNGREVEPQACWPSSVRSKSLQKGLDHSIGIASKSTANIILLIMALDFACNIAPHLVTLQIAGFPQSRCCGPSPFAGPGAVIGLTKSGVNTHGLRKGNPHRHTHEWARINTRCPVNQCRRLDAQSTRSRLREKICNWSIL